jgi:hypothetical protein
MYLGHDCLKIMQAPDNPLRSKHHTRLATDCVVALMAFSHLSEVFLVKQISRPTMVFSLRQTVSEEQWRPHVENRYSLARNITSCCRPRALQTALAIRH